MSSGELRRAVLARPARVRQPRMTQIMNLNHLAPDIQEELLFLPPVTVGRDPIHERMLRPLAAILDWQEQRTLWTRMQRAATKTHLTSMFPC
jgi:hypothetical protein